jgi:hypothetical protein
MAFVDIGNVIYGCVCILRYTHTHTQPHNNSTVSVTVIFLTELKLHFICHALFRYVYAIHFINSDNNNYILQMPQTTRFAVFVVIWVQQLHRVCQLGLPASHNGWDKAPVRKLYQVGFSIKTLKQCYTCVWC